MHNSAKKVIGLVLCINVLVLLIGIPQYKRDILKDYRENLLRQSIGRAVDYYYEYEKSDDVYELELLVYELRFYHTILSELERDGEIEKISPDVTMAMSILQDRKNDAEGMEYLIDGLEFLEEDIYSDAGYSRLLDFGNANIH